MVNIPEISTDLIQIITVDQAWHYGILPKFSNGTITHFYIDKNKLRSDVKEELELLLGLQIILEGIDNFVINQWLNKYYRKGYRHEQNKSKSLNFSQNSDEFLIELISSANAVGSSDIHIEKYEDRCRVRIRIDGKLIEKFVLKKDEYPAIINRIKIKSNLDIAEKRLPQDGRIYFSQGTDKFDIRVSILPTLYGEKIVLRLLSKDAADIDINTLGFSSQQLYDFLEAIRKPHGIILISGPTGSGKTTTLYATLKILNKEDCNILTIEDPIEYTLEGINQVQLKESIGLSFASALRTFLRQDPDIIMLGEIRDGETAQMAIRAALTGHLVLSTIHTNSAWGTISRLIDMGVPSFLLANTINLTVAQRLVRLLCPICKVEKATEPNDLPKNYKAEHNLKRHFVAHGCENCFYTGYKGRKAVYEVIPLDKELCQLIKEDTSQIEPVLKQKNIQQLSQIAFDLIEKGETSIEECYSILLNQK
jgi:general secretion pathway protein E/type IV pilus assembly protein PilB